MAKSISFFAIVLCMYCTINSVLLLSNPPVWPDEAGYADVSHTILTKHILYSQLDPGVTQNTHTIYWYPPLMFYCFAFLFGIFGFTIETMRISAVMSGFIFLILLFFLAKRHIKHMWLIWGMMFFLLTEFLFMRATRIARPEIYIMTLGVAALLCTDTIRWRWGIVCSGFLVGAALMFQLFGGGMFTLMIGVLLVFQTKNLREAIKSVIAFLTPICLWFLWWFWSVGFNFKYIWLNTILQAKRKAMEPGFFKQVFKHTDQWYKAYLMMLVAGSVFAIIYVVFIKKRSRPLLISVLFLGIMWICMFFGKQFWYFAYITPFFVFHYALMFDTMANRKKLQTIACVTVVFVVICTFVINLHFLSQNFQALFSNTAYSRFSLEVVRHIPNGSSVLISAIPDPYFFLKKNTSLILYHFIGSPGLKKQYISILQKSDYIIYTGAIDFVYGNFLPTYIKEHAQNAIPIGNGANEYGAWIFKMKK